MNEYQAYGASLPAPRMAAAMAMPRQQNGSLLALIGRLEEAVEAETKAIRDPGFDIDASNARKSRHLYELNRALKGDAVPGPEHREAILRLRAKLAANEAAVAAHLNAVSEVASLIQNVIHNAETDGTYSSAAFGPAGA